MEPLFIGILITLTVCASHPLETTKSPLDIGNNAILSNSKTNDDVVPSIPIHNSHTEEIRLNITLKSDENDKEVVDIDMGMYKHSQKYEVCSANPLLTRLFMRNCANKKFNFFFFISIC
jgi:hypothetical protein